MSNIIIQGFPNSGAFTQTDIIGYSAFSCVLSQSGTDEPVMENIIENTLGVNVTWYYDGIGQYYGVFDKEIFTTAYSYVTLSGSTVSALSDVISVIAYLVDIDIIYIETRRNGVMEDGLMTYIPPCVLQIKI